MENVKNPATDKRNYLIEILRIISCFGIVYDHGNDASWAQEIGDICLIIFLFISVYFLSPQNNYRIFISKRITRLLIPWVFWFIFYGLLRIINGGIFLPIKGDIISSVLNGTRSHLWYLPFIFIISILTVFYYNQIENRLFFKKINILLFILLSITLLCLMPLWRPWSLTLYPPWGSWFLAFPAICISISLASMNKYHSKRSIVILFLIIILLIAGFWAITTRWDLTLGRPYFFAIIIISIALYLNFNLSKYSRNIMYFSNFTFGIYLIHPLLYAIGKKIGFDGNFYIPFVIYFLSLIIILIANKIPIQFVKKII